MVKCAALPLANQGVVLGVDGVLAQGSEIIILKIYVSKVENIEIQYALNLLTFDLILLAP